MIDDERVKSVKPGDFKIEVPDFVRFLESVFKTTKCPHCATKTSWTLDASNGVVGDDSEVTVYQMDYSSGTMFRPFYVMSCDNCGSIRQIRCTRVQEWLEKNKALKQ